jgi:hypothetical protein
MLWAGYVAFMGEGIGFLKAVLRGYLDLKGRKTDRGENCIMMNFIACTLHGILFG